MAGKGGVGKTTAAATIATAASECGLSVLLVEVAGRSAAAPMFGAGPQGYAETVLVPAARAAEADGLAEGARQDGAGSPAEIRCRSITPDEALIEWLSGHGFKRIVRRTARSGVLEVIATATPGIKDLLVLGRIKALEVERAADLIVVDAPATGHAVGFLRSAIGVRDAARTGTLHRQAVEVLDLVRDPARCQVMLVATCEETPVNELIEASFAVEEEVGVTLGPVVINGLLPELHGLDADIAGILRPRRKGDARAGHDPRAGCREAQSRLQDEAQQSRQETQPGQDDVRPHPRDAASGIELAGLLESELADLQTAAVLRLGRQRLQAEQLARLDDELPLPRIRLPHLFTPRIGPGELSTLAAAFTTEVAGLAS